MRLFCKGEGCVPNDSAKGKGDEAGEEVDFVGVVWCESRRGGRRSAGGSDVNVEEIEYGKM